MSAALTCLRPGALLWNPEQNMLTPWQCRQWHCLVSGVWQLVTPGESCPNRLQVEAFPLLLEGMKQASLANLLRSSDAHFLTNFCWSSLLRSPDAQNRPSRWAFWAPGKLEKHHPFPVDMPLRDRAENSFRSSSLGCEGCQQTLPKWRMEAGSMLRYCMNGMPEGRWLEGSHRRD